MNISKHTCISCAYLYVDASKPITSSERKTISSKHWDSKYFSFDYFAIKCSRNKLSNFIISVHTKDDVYNEITKARACKEWFQYSEGISATIAEDRHFNIQSINRANLAIVIAILAVIVSIATLIYIMIHS